MRSQLVHRNAASTLRYRMADEDLHESQGLAAISHPDDKGKALAAGTVPGSSIADIAKLKDFRLDGGRLKEISDFDLGG